MSRANEPAAPVANDASGNTHYGLTVREHLAAMALQGLLANAGVISPYDTKYPGAMALCAVVFADALLTELAKGPK